MTAQLHGSTSAACAAIFLLLFVALLNFSVKLFKARLKIARLRKRGMVRQSKVLWMKPGFVTDRCQADASMESNLGTFGLLLQIDILPTNRCPSELSPGHDSAKVTRSWTVILCRYLAFRASNAHRSIDRRIASNHTEAFSPQIPCTEIFSSSHSRRPGPGHNGGRSLENMAWNLQSRI